MTERRESDSWMENDLTVGSGATESKILSVPGGDTISGIINRTSSYDLDLVWLSNDKSTVINTESVASGATGSTEFSEDWHSAQNVRVEVTDTSTSSDTADITINAR
ncbi:hypothetical protein OSG_eHP23_00225 [environmental Halophage eHP-23]|nr:hypothetical protein OSG_eHP23_00225 [environmental Halophage eHP-23]